MGRYPELAGKTAIVTGSTAGIGESVALALAANDVNVVVNGRQGGAQAEQIVGRAQQLGGSRSFFARADVTDPGQVERLFKEAAERLGRIDILVNCAGGFERRKLVHEMSPEEWDEVIALNLRSMFLCTRAALPGMIERRAGRIVNISSWLGRGPNITAAAHYVTAKAGMLGFTRQVAREVAEYGITVNATAPGVTWSPRIRRLYSDEVAAGIATSLPLRRISDADEQAGAVVFLCSDDAAYITGATIDVNGGGLMK